MDGGPSHIDTFDPKPNAPAEVRGDLRAIATSVPGVHINEKFPRLAGLMKHAAILRGMSTAEADHGRARIYMHTGYKPGAGGVTYPGLGSTVSAELGNPDSPLPNFVVTGVPLGKYEFLTNPRLPRPAPSAPGDHRPEPGHGEPRAGRRQRRLRRSRRSARSTGARVRSHLEGGAPPPPIARPSAGPCR